MIPLEFWGFMQTVAFSWNERHKAASPVCIVGVGYWCVSWISIVVFYLQELGWVPYMETQISIPEE